MHSFVYRETWFIQNKFFKKKVLCALSTFIRDEFRYPISASPISNQTHLYPIWNNFRLKLGLNLSYIYHIRNYLDWIWIFAASEGPNPSFTYFEVCYSNAWVGISSHILGIFFKYCDMLVARIMVKNFYTVI